MQDYELLELLLTFAIPYSDVKPLAKRVIEHFGSFTQVLDATPEALMEVIGIKEYSAILIRLVKACSEYALKSEALKRQPIKSLDNLVEYCRASMGGLPDEQFRVIFFNSQNEVIAEEIVQEGTVNQTVVYPRKVLELALKHKATGLILVHNHPSGNLTPSAADRELTRALVKAGQSPQPDGPRPPDHRPPRLFQPGGTEYVVEDFGEGARTLTGPAPSPNPSPNPYKGWRVRGGAQLSNPIVKGRFANEPEPSAHYANAEFRRPQAALLKPQ